MSVLSSVLPSVVSLIVAVTGLIKAIGAGKSASQAHTDLAPVKQAMQQAHPEFMPPVPPAA